MTILESLHRNVEVLRDRFTHLRNRPQEHKMRIKTQNGVRFGPRDGLPSGRGSVMSSAA